MRASDERFSTLSLPSEIVRRSSSTLNAAWNNGSEVAAGIRGAGLVANPAWSADGSGRAVVVVSSGDVVLVVRPVEVAGPAGVVARGVVVAGVVVAGAVVSGVVDGVVVGVGPVDGGAAGRRVSPGDRRDREQGRRKQREQSSPSTAVRSCRFS